MLAPLILLGTQFSFHWKGSLFDLSVETKERLERTMMEVRILAYQIRKELIRKKDI